MPRRSPPKKRLARFSRKMSRPRVTIMWAECGASTMRRMTSAYTRAPKPKKSGSTTTRPR